MKAIAAPDVAASREARGGRSCRTDFLLTLGLAVPSACVRWSGREIGTVDGFQGREKEAIVISLVRSNPDQELGFLTDVRRMNVALTRARRKLLVVGDGATLSAHPFYADLLSYVEAAGLYRSVWEEA